MISIHILALCPKWKGVVFGIKITLKLPIVDISNFDVKYFTVAAQKLNFYGNTKNSPLKHSLRSHISARGWGVHPLAIFSEGGGVRIDNSQKPCYSFTGNVNFIDQF